MATRHARPNVPDGAARASFRSVGSAPVSFRSSSFSAENATELGTDRE
jgi:hypothetical protein